MGIQTIDIFSALNNHSELFPDSLHPNAAGAKIIAQEVYRAVIGR
jgi:lysophospholipase L1-like esterase